MQQLLIYNVGVLRKQYNNEVRAACICQLNGLRLSDDVVFLQWLLYRLHVLWCLPLELPELRDGFYFPVKRVPINQKLDSSIYRKFGNRGVNHNTLLIGNVCHVELRRNELVLYLNQGY